MAFFAYISGHAIFSGYLNIIHLPGSGEMAIYCAALVGGCLGFLWVNAYPAQVFMGDTGALAIGAGLAAVAVLLKKEIFLLMLAGVPVMEVASVMIQRYYFKYTKKRYGEGRRVFLISPLHHHFEKSGIFEAKVTVRFWIIGILFLFLTLTSIKVR
jgi:phospho-N-acetylmuramoyl-pentapeptide-transferase